MRFIKKWDDFIEWISTVGLVVSVAFMLSLTVLTIILRWFNITLLWVDPLVRHLVFLTAFLGGTVATGKKTHIAIDIVSKFLETKNWPKGELYLKRFITLICILTICWLNKTSIDFYHIELEFGKEVFWGLHSSIFVSIIPIGLTLITLRFINQLLMSFGPLEVKKEII
ncbi:MAG: TRAP transporter small permease subunit [Halobacteriovoraceae bacterium]|nr:TRAP transporter small permease subunit [Halobacteriovoraceae bacterium]